MGVASPLQSSRPIEYWLDGLKAAELVALWEFLSRNLDDKDPEHAQVAAEQPLTSCMLPGSEDLPTNKEVKKHIYSESLPSSFLCLKTQRRRKCSERPKAAVALGL